MDLQLSVTEVCQTCKAEFTKPDLEKHLEGGCLVKPKAKPLFRCSNGNATKSVSSNLCMICGYNFGSVSDILKHFRTGCTFPTSMEKVNNKSKDSKKDSKVSNKSKKLNNLSVSIKKEKKDNSYVRQDAVNMDVVKTEIVDKAISDSMIETVRMSDAKLEVTGIKSIGYETVESVKVRKKTDGVKNMVIDASDSAEKMDIHDVKTEMVDKEISTVMNKTAYVSDKKLEVTDANSFGNETLESRQVRNKTGGLTNMVIGASDSTKKMDMFVVKIEIIDKEVCDIMKINNSMSNTDLEVTEINLVENKTLELRKERKKIFATSKIIIDASSAPENICKVASEDVEEQGNQAKSVKKKPKKSFHICKTCWKAFDNISDFLEHTRIGCSFTRIKINENNHVVVRKNSVFQKEANKFHKSSTNIADINATNTIHPQVNTDVKHLQTLSDLVVIEKVDGSDHKVKKEDMTDAGYEVVDTCSLDVRSDHVDINTAYCTDTISVSNETSYTHDVRNKTGMTDGILVGTASTEKVCRIDTSNLKETDKKGVPCEFDYSYKVFDEANVIMVKPKGNYISFDCSVCDKKLSNGIALKKHLLCHEVVDSLDVRSDPVDTNNAYCTDIISVSNVSIETSYTHDVRNEIGMTDEILVGTASTEKVCKIATSNLEETDKKGVPSEFDYCEKIFDETNVIMVKPKGNYVSFDCSVCGKKISNGIALKKHLLCHKRINSRSIGKEREEANTRKCVVKRKDWHFGCCLCGKLFCGGQVLKKHLLDHEEIRKRKKCYTCFTPLASHSPKNLNEHLKAQVKVLSHENKHSSIFNRSAGKTHQMGLIGKPPVSNKNLKCGIKGKRIVSQRGYRDPWQEHKTEVTFECNICMRSLARLYFLNKQKAYIHKKILSMKFSCPTCQKTFSPKECFKSHLNTHSKNKLYLCDICGQRYKHAAALSLHKRSHKAEYSHFKCDTCNNLFTTYTHLEEHIQVHVGHKR